MFSIICHDRDHRPHYFRVLPRWNALESATAAFGRLVSDRYAEEIASLAAASDPVTYARLVAAEATIQAAFTAQGPCSVRLPFGLSASLNELEDEVWDRWADGEWAEAARHDSDRERFCAD